MIFLFSGLESFSRSTTNKLQYGYPVEKGIRLKERELNGWLRLWYLQIPNMKKYIKNEKSISLKTIKLSKSFTLLMLT